ncbi:hypothetical protein HMPREF9955_2052 [Staphylococcus epidermidis FS1]|nr:hypothetical protein HMPREF9955_2052 [Staphylococcus epidermidis FS1]
MYVQFTWSSHLTTSFCKITTLSFGNLGEKKAGSFNSNLRATGVLERPVNFIRTYIIKIIFCEFYCDTRYRLPLNYPYPVFYPSPLLSLPCGEQSNLCHLLCLYLNNVDISNCHVIILVYVTYAIVNYDRSQYIYYSGSYI